MDELTHSEGSQFKDKTWQFIEGGGYSITTTLDLCGPRPRPRRPRTRPWPASVMSGQPANLQAALVAVEPGTGRILAYYGGH
jgi:membrane peptidoglycan carboxypeptidase